MRTFFDMVELTMWTNGDALAIGGLMAGFQAAAWLAAAGGLILAIVKFRAELRQGRLQRARDLRWRQAEAGKSLNDEMQTDERAWSAMQMLDYGNRQFNIPAVGMVKLTEDEIKSALDPERPDADPAKCDYIRDCFDCLFYFMAMIDHYTRSELILEEDVAYPMEYYLQRLARYHSEVAAYLAKYRLARTCKFLMRYGGWDDLQPVIDENPIPVFLNASARASISPE